MKQLKFNFSEYNCPICGKIDAFEEPYDICETCSWEDDPFMSNQIATVKFFDCNGEEIPAPEGIGGKWSSPNHCDSIADAKEAWFKYKTPNHFDKDKAPLTAEEKLKIRREQIRSSPDNSKKFTAEETDQIFKKIFGKNYKKKEE